MFFIIKDFQYQHFDQYEIAKQELFQIGCHASNDCVSIEFLFLIKFETTDFSRGEKIGR